MGARKIYNDEIIIAEVKKILRENFKEVTNMTQLHTQLKKSFKGTSLEVPSLVTLTRIIRKYLNMDDGTRVKREDLFRMAMLDMDIDSFVSLCKSIDKTQVVPMETNNLYLFFRLRPPFIADNVDYILKKRFPNQILATVYDNNTITVFTKDLASKKTIICTMLKILKKKITNHPELKSIFFEPKPLKENDLCWLLGITREKVFKDKYNQIVYSKNNINDIFVLLFNLIATLDKNTPMNVVYQQLLEVAEPIQIKIPTFKTLKKHLKDELVKRKIIKKNSNRKITLKLIRRLMPRYCYFYYYTMYIYEYSTLIFNFEVSKLSEESLFESIKFLKQELLKTTDSNEWRILMIKESYPNALVMFVKNKGTKSKMLNQKLLSINSEALSELKTDAD